MVGTSFLEPACYRGQVTSISPDFSFLIYKNGNTSSINFIEFLWELNKDKLHRMLSIIPGTQEKVNKHQVSLFPVIEDRYPSQQGILTNYS